MKMFRTILSLAIFVALFSVSTNAQFFEDFEDGSKASYSIGSVTLTTGSWTFDDALLGSSSGDRINGSQGVRVRDGEIYMNFNRSNGADVISFQAANSDFSGDGSGKLQVQYSTNSGSSWTNIGEEVILTDALSQVSISVEIQGNIRFKIIKTAGGRVNIDDLSITDFVEAAAEPTINVLVDNATASDDDTIDFGSTLDGTSLTRTVEIKNTGNPNLVISSVTATGQGFSVTDLQDSTLAFNESTEVTLTFEPTNDGQFAGDFAITSNAVNAASFGLTLAGEGFADGDVIPISDARELALDTRVTVAGRVTVANEFGGPMYMQDATAGIAVFWAPLHENVEIGDSVQISGPLTVFKPIPGADEDFLLQISDTETDDNIVFEIFDVPNKEVVPEIVTVQELNTDDYQGQLVLIQNAMIDFEGAFQQDNYPLIDFTGTTDMRIDNTTNLIGVQAPQEAVNVVGVAGIFGGTVQILPRFVDDLGVEEVVFPGDEISKDQTLDVVTWNIEWFGSAGNDPSDDDLQLQNVITVVETIDADIYALQEIASPTRFNQLVEGLEGYGGFLASFSQSQETAYLFKRSSIDSLSGVTLSSSDGFTQSNWANGRYPLLFHFNANINGEQQEVYAFNIHAKATTKDPASDYSQRLNASIELKEYLDRNHPKDNVIFLGDYNDEIELSVVNNNDSPYMNFDDDTEYSVVTKNLEVDGFASQSGGSFLDHITFTSELSDEYFVGTERVENPSYVGSYLSTTSDHYPVWTRFKFGILTSNDDEVLETPETITLNQNYPNPFNPSTVISYTLNTSTNVSLNVYDITGRKVATLIDGRQTAGVQEVSFDASSLASGVYIYRLQTTDGASLTKKMILVK